jgi:hypothetical protein
MAHNDSDTRCRYTLGARRCPAVGSVRSGQWWVCDLHTYWAEDPSDPDRDADGRDALEIQEKRFGAARGEVLRAADAPGVAPGAKPGRSAEALAAVRAVTGESGLPGWQRRLEARELALPYYRARRRQLQQLEGYGVQAAHEAALGDLAEEIVRRLG